MESRGASFIQHRCERCRTEGPALFNTGVKDVEQMGPALFNTGVKDGEQRGQLCLTQV